MYIIPDDAKNKTVPKEVCQFFGTTSERKDLIVKGEMSNDPDMGPGRYDT